MNYDPKRTKTTGAFLAPTAVNTSNLIHKFLCYLGNTQIYKTV